LLPGWGTDAEKQAKQVLYRYLEEMQVTKAALYLQSTEGGFELATYYGFGKRDQVAVTIATGNPLFDWVRRHRTNPAFLNQINDAPELAGMLEGAGTAKLLTIPIVVRGRLVGFVDARDKARKEPFAQQDATLARRISVGIERLLAELNLYGAGVPPGDETPYPPQEAVAPQPAVPVAAQPGEPPPPTLLPPTPSPSPVLPEAAAPPLLHRAIVEEAAAHVRLLARLPGVAIAALTVSDERTARVLALRTLPLDDRQREVLATHQLRAFEASGVRVPPPGRWAWDEHDSGGEERRGDEIRSAVLHAFPPVHVAFTVVTNGGTIPGDIILTAVANHFSVALKLRNYRRAVRNLARILLEPGESSYSYLRQHSQAVSELAQRMAVAVGFGEDDEELVTIAAYLHDVGMRELEYQRTYRLERPSEVEKRMYQRHPIVGARIVESASFPGDLVSAIRHHHERWDGKGYPSQIAGRTIPIASRIIHVAEVWDTLTSTTSYRRSVGRDAALDIIRGEAGRQFDPELVPVLEQIVHA
jgi:putative nucleotidyltransferase with HDIG domain